MSTFDRFKKRKYVSDKNNNLQSINNTILYQEHTMCTLYGSNSNVFYIPPRKEDSTGNKTKKW